MNGNGAACLVAALFSGTVVLMAGPAIADPAPIEITVGKENAKRTIIPGGGKDPAQSFRDCPYCPEMVVIPAGSFMMGSAENEPGHKWNEGPQHKVTFAKPLAVARFEVTFDNGAGWNDEGWGRNRRPVILISHLSVRQFLDVLKERTGKKYRLLTEAEWEYAARAGTTSPYPTGATITKQQARFGEEIWSADGKTAEVGSFPPNAWGLYDMPGNVWEQVADCWHPTYEGAPQDGSQWPLTRIYDGYFCKGDKDCICKGDKDCQPEEICEAYVMRGGSWGSDPKSLRSAARSKYNGVDANNRYAGFRVVRSLD